jgi:hypothetical protein
MVVINKKVIFQKGMPLSGILDVSRIENIIINNFPEKIKRK